MNVAAIPSPHSSNIHIGPLEVHIYGICIALGILSAIWLSQKRWSARGGDPEDITAIAIWAVPAGIIGARVYHVVTDWELYRHNFAHAFAVWDGGLGIWGRIAGGIIGGVYIVKKRNISTLAMLDVVAPGLALARAIGRFGNYFNQELFGKPTTFPWGLHIDFINRPPDYIQFSTFHPTFLYESLWNFALCGVLLLLDRRFHLSDSKNGKLFLCYVSGYTFARFFIERLRIDYAHTIAGLRLNEWTSLFLFTISSILLIAMLLRGQPHPADSTKGH